MPGWLDNGMPNPSIFTGNELLPVDTLLAGGAAPQSGSLSIQQLAVLMSLYSNFSNKTTVAGSIYYSTYVVTTPNPNASIVNITQPRLITGINVLVGTTGGTDTWCVGLYNSAGVLVASSALAGATAGTAGTWQQFAFTAPYAAAPGVYLIAVQSNGTTAHPAMFNFPAPSNTTTAPVLTGSQTGTFGTLANIGTVSTTYTANLGPVVQPYL